jgi:predicted nuclease of restriction endonuclease-like (RecB) superfamily
LLLTQRHFLFGKIIEPHHFTMSNTPVNTNDPAFFTFVEEVKQLIKVAQYRALQTVNQEQMALYWEIGRMIVERQQKYSWGKGVVEHLAAELQAVFPDTKGYSAQNLWYMRQFFVEYSQSEILQPLVGEISWSKHLIVMAKCKDENQRFFYLKMASRHAWSKAMLINAIDGQTWEHTLTNQQNFEETLPNTLATQAASVIRDEYSFDFLNLNEPYTEAQLEQALLGNIRDFLATMGGDFTFVGNQFAITVEGEVYKIDLLLFHRTLQCLVAIDLKIDGFKPDYAGKMNFYLSALNVLNRKPHENPSIGIIICKSKKRTVVEFALQDMTKPIGVATYTFTDALPKELSQFFPTSEQFIERVEKLAEAMNRKA